MKFAEDVITKFEGMLHDIKQSETTWKKIEISTNDQLQEYTQRKQTKKNKNTIEACENSLKICDNRLDEIRIKKDLVRAFLSDLYQWYYQKL